MNKQQNKFLIIFSFFYIQSTPPFFFSFYPLFNIRRRKYKILKKIKIKSIEINKQIPH